MRIGSHNVLAILLAAAAFLAIGFVFYAVIFQQQWQVWTGFNEADYAGLEWRMGLMPVMPLMIAIGMSFVVGWRGVRTLSGGAVTGVIVGLFLLVGARLYGFAYSPEVPQVLLLDSIHLWLGCIVSGAILGAMR